MKVQPAYYFPTGDSVRYSYKGLMGGLILGIEIVTPDESYKPRACYRILCNDGFTIDYAPVCEEHRLEGKTT